MTKQIEVIAGGIFGASGEIPVGTTFPIQGEVPESWAKKVRVTEAVERAVPVTNPAKTKKREELEKQATAAGLGFADDATDDELAAAIKAAKGK